ncbi:hypothetical protein DFJ74DRAFT_775065 [Hyaloraphidium curvatum]|nr:hypothetical protein DFJ74DRAFT_775065 [Hyaloraphidium curvatum]
MEAEMSAAEMFQYEIDRDTYATQVRTLHNIGYTDEVACIKALRKSNGSIPGAIDALRAAPLPSRTSRIPGGGLNAAAADPVRMSSGGLDSGLLSLSDEYRWSEDDRRRHTEKEEMVQRRLAAERAKAEAEARIAEAELRQKAELEHLAELVRLEEEREALEKAARAAEEKLKATEREHKAKEDELLRRLGRLTAKEPVAEAAAAPAQSKALALYDQAAAALSAATEKAGLLPAPQQGNQPDQGAVRPAPASESSNGSATVRESAGSDAAAAPEPPAKAASHPSLRSSYEIAPSDIEQGKFLGAGGFGQVYEGTYQKHTRVALKMIGPGASPRQLEKRRADFEAEMLIWGQLPYHANVLPLIGWCSAEPDYRPARPEGCPNSAWEVMTRCWAFEPAARPAFGEVADKLKAVLRELEGTPD